MGHTQLAIVEPSNRFADLPFNLTFDTVNVKTKKSTINLAVNRGDGATAGRCSWRGRKGGGAIRMVVAGGDVTVCGSTRRETMTRAKAIRMTSCWCPRNRSVRMKGIKRGGGGRDNATTIKMTAKGAMMGQWYLTTLPKTHNNWWQCNAPVRHCTATFQKSRESYKMLFSLLISLAMLVRTSSFH